MVTPVSGGGRFNTTVAGAAPRAAPSAATVGASQAAASAIQLPQPSPTFTSPNRVLWAWSLGGPAKAHSRNLHAMIVHAHSQDTWVFSGGKDGTVCGVTLQDIDRGNSATEILPKVANKCWVTAMAHHPHKDEVVIGYRDGCVQLYEIPDPLQWTPKYTVRQSAAAAAVAWERVYSLAYLPEQKAPGPGDYQIAVGMSPQIELFGAAAPSKARSNQKIVSKAGPTDWVAGILPVSSSKMLAIGGTCVVQFERTKCEWERKRAVRPSARDAGSDLAKFLEKEQAGRKVDSGTLKKTKEALEGVQAHPQSFLLVSRGEQARLAVSHASGRVTLYDVKDQTDPTLPVVISDMAEGGPVKVLDVGQYVRHTYASGEKDDFPSRRAWSMVDLGEGMISVGTDCGRLFIIDVIAGKRLAEIPVIEGERISCQVVAPDRKALYVHVAPKDSSRGDPAFSLSIFQ